MNRLSPSLTASVLAALTMFLQASAARAQEGPAVPPAKAPLPLSPAPLPVDPAPLPESADPPEKGAVSVPATPAASVDMDPAGTPPAARRVTGKATEYTPLLRFEPGGVSLQGDFLLAFRGEGVSSFQVDRDGGAHQAGAVLAPMLRAGLRADTRTLLKSVNLHFEYEHDLPTGLWASDTTINGVEMPGSAPIEQQIRKLYLRASLGPWLHIGGGYMTNQFGLGLLANDGASGNWAPGSARFADNRGGDRVLRGFIGTGPLTSAGVTATFAVDRVEGDDVLLPGDEAFQVIGTASVGYGKPWGAGVFIVQRRQDTPGGARTDATVIDLTARYGRIRPNVSYSVEGEFAFITGQTTLSPTPDFPVHRLRQVGAAVRAAARWRYAGGVLDLLFASGDGSPDDDLQTAFKADPNFETGLLLFRHVLAAQTGRSAVTAANPELVGVPADDLDRLPTRGSPTNTFSVFPRAYVRPVDGLEAYLGALLSWSPAPLFDPLNTRFAGGVVTNALDGRPGGFLGAEVDLGVRQRLLFGGTELTVGAEGAVFFPGDAFTAADGTIMGPVLGGRALINYRL